MFSNLSRVANGAAGRARPGRVLGVGAAVTAAIAALTGVPALAVGSTHTARPEARSSTTSEASAPGARGVLLPTGQRVWVSGSGAKARVAIQRAAGDSGQSMITMRRSTGTYVVPASALPYLGHGLDRELFNVSGRHSPASSAVRVPVSIRYRSQVPQVPGVTVSSRSGGVARGYLTAKSARSFGRSLQARFAADAAAGWKRRPTLLGADARLESAAPKPVQVQAATVVRSAEAAKQAKQAKVTLTVKAIGVDGKPLAWGEAGLTDFTDPEGSSDLEFKNGSATVKVSPGRYALEAANFTNVAAGKSEHTVQVRYVVLPELRLSGAKATVTVDYRRATIAPQAVTPRPHRLVDYGFSWMARFDDGADWFGNVFSNDAAGEVLLAPIPAVTGVKQSVGHSWQLAAPGDRGEADYTYDLAATGERLDAKPSFVFTTAELATLRGTYYGDGSGRPAAFLRYTTGLINAEAGSGTFQRVQPGTRRTEYVAHQGARSSGIPVWFETYLADGGSDDEEDPAALTNYAAPSLYRKGETRSLSWGRGPLVAGIPRQGGDFPGTCFMCRGKTQMNLLLVPFLDSADHVGDVKPPADSISNARFRLYQGSKKINDIDGLFAFGEDQRLVGNVVKVGAGKGTFKGVFEVDRRTQDPRLSTRTQTVISFSSSRDAGPRPPLDWSCPASASNCRVLPVLMARAYLSTGTDGSLPAATSLVTVKVARVQHAGSSGLKSVKLQIRFRNRDWTTVKLQAKGKGVYTGTVNTTKFAGQIGDLHVTATDKGGSRFEQTVARAFAVAAK
jgi:hypothetical protein